MKKITFFIATAAFLASTSGFAQPLYKDSTQPITKRVADLLSRMTPEEKFWQLFMIPGDIPAGEEEKYKNGIFGFQVSATAKKGGSRSVMTAYNSLDGTAASANEWLLTKTLKEDWNFKGFVISDADAVNIINALHLTSPDNAVSAAQAIDAGLDVIFQTSWQQHTSFIPHFLDGGVDPKRIDDAVSRVLTAKFELGLFEHPYVTDADLKKYDDGSTENTQIVHSTQIAHNALARQAAVESIVLLKNEKDVLPLDQQVRSIAVIGVDATEARLGGYSGPGNGKVSILNGIRQRAGAAVQVSYTPGCGRESREWTVIPADVLSLTGKYFNNLTLSGPPVLTRVDKTINFQWTLSAPAPEINHDFYSARWTGTLHAPKTGRYRIGLDGDDGYRLYLDNRLVIDNWNKQTYSTRLTEFSFEMGHDYAIRVEFFEPVGNAHLKLIWNVDTEDDWQAKINAAVATAAKADVAIVVAGIREGEFQDRASLALPGHQEQLIQRIAATGKPVVVLLVGGSAITMSSWLDKVQAVADVWYPGEEGGHAVASVLFGDEDPGGRLPISFPVSEAQLPWVYNHLPTGRGDDYNNLTGLPLFPFGFGLSFTHFAFSDLQLDKPVIAGGGSATMTDADSATVTCTVKNTGTRAGDEVVQLYIKQLTSSIDRPVIELKGFQRIHLQPGEARKVSFVLSPAVLRSLDKDLHWVVEPGDYRIMIGASSRDLRLRETLKIH